jgi:uncharacterized membrane protein
MAGFPLALAAFVLLHIGVSATGLRGLLVRRIGEGPFRGLFALASAGALAWMIWAYAQMRADPFDGLNAALWAPPAWGRYAAQALMIISFLFVVVGLTTPGPTLAGAEKLLAKDEPARGVLRITRHPFLWGVAIWAVAHLLANGERFAVMLFGALGLMVLLGTRSIDRKGAARDPEGWARFAAVTSNIPFAAIVQGRNRLALGEMWWRMALALAAYAGFAYVHQWVIGVPAVP